MFKRIDKFIINLGIISILFSTLFFVKVVQAAYPLVSPGGTITIGEFVYDDDFLATTSDCTITINNPSNTPVVSNQIMSTTTAGWHYYDFASTNTEGIWPTVMTCGSVPTGDLARLDKTFIVGYANASSTEIAAEVWEVATSTLTNAGTVGKQLVDNLDVPVSSVGGESLTAADIWAYSSRSLSSFGTLVSDIATAVWSNGTRSLTTFGSLVADVWNNGTRTLSSAILGGGGNLATESYIDISTSTVIAQIDNNESLISALNNISAADVWSVASSTLTVNGTIGKHIVDNLDTQVSSVGGGSLTAADVWSYATRTLTETDSSSIALAVWSEATRDLTDYGNDITAADVWNVLSSTLTLQDSIGEQLTQGVDVAISTRASQASLDALNNISAADVWSYANRSITDPDAIWEYALSQIGEAGSVGQLLKDNINASISSRASHTAADVWSVVSRTLTSNANFNDPNSATIAAAVWSEATRDLTDYGNDITAQEVWDVLSSNLTVDGSIGKQLATNVDATISSRSTLTAADVWAYSTRSLTTFGTLVSDITTAVWSNGTRSLTTFGSLVADVWNNGTRTLSSSVLEGGGSIATELFVDTSLNNATSSIITEVLQNRSLISALNNISAADVWAYGTRSLNSGTVTLDNASVEDIWGQATSTLVTTGSVGKLLVDNLDAQVSSVGGGSLTAADIWSYATRTITDYSEGSIATAVWSDASRTLTNYGNDITAADVWNVLTSSLTTVGSIGNLASTSLDTTLSTRASLSSQQAGWTANMSNTDRVLMGKTYRAKLYLRNYESVPTNSFTSPAVTLYDADRNVVVSGVAMTNLANGVYEYTYSIPGNASEGLWEALISTQVESGKTIQTNDYWTVEGSPAQVIINSITDVSIPSISANVTITNEGISGYEYQYEWCVVSSINNACGGGDDVYYASAAKYINSGEDWNTNLSATVPSAGSYFFKLVVYYGAEQSGSSRSFTAISDAPGPPPGGGGGGGGGGGVPPVNPTIPTTTPDIIYKTADFNRDGRVNSIDFSILLAFWRTDWPFRNLYVDINNDRQVNSVEFSIMLFQWDGR